MCFFEAARLLTGRGALRRKRCSELITGTPRHSPPAPHPTHIAFTLSPAHITLGPVPAPIALAPTHITLAPARHIIYPNNIYSCIRKQIQAMYNFLFIY